MDDDNCSESSADSVDDSIVKYEDPISKCAFIWNNNEYNDSKTKRELLRENGKVLTFDSSSKKRKYDTLCTKREGIVLPSHCGSSKCMLFKCNCRTQNLNKMLLPLNPDIFDNEVLDILEEEAKKRLKEFPKRFLPRRNKYFWFSTIEPTMVIITDTEDRPSINHSLVKLFGNIYNRDALKSDLIRVLLSRILSNDKKENFVKMTNHMQTYEELIAIGEKIKSEERDKISVFYAHINGHVNLNDIGSPLNKYKSKDTDKLIHINLNKEPKVVFYIKGNFSLKQLLFQDTQMHYIATSNIVSIPLPTCSSSCKWLMIYVDEIFAYIQLNRNNYTIHYDTIIKCMQLSQDLQQTIILNSIGINRRYDGDFGFYFAPNHIDKFFVGPYNFTDKKDLKILTVFNGDLVNSDAHNEKLGKANKNWYWLYQFYEPSELDDESDFSDTDSMDIIDLR